MKNIQHAKLWLQNRVYLAIAAQIVFAIVITALPSTADAVQLTNRAITMSDSGPSSNASITTGVGSGTKVSYKLDFTTTNTSTAIGGIVIDFCSNTPLIGDTCTAPTGFDVNRASTTVTAQTITGAAFSVYTADAQANRIIATRGTASNIATTNSISFGDGSTQGFTNPNTTGTFYARVYTYGTATAAQSHNTGNPTNYIDYGGVALSTASVITITARVQENIIFCVFGGASPSSNCAANGSTTSPALTIGHVTTGTVKYIDSTAIDTANAYTQLSTNASSGAIVRMHSSVSGGGLSSGANTIPPANSGANSPAALTAGTAAFGLFVAAGTGGTGTVSADANYNDGTATHYGMDSTTSGSNVTTTYGDSIFSSTTPVSNVNNTLTFAATASNITPAGLYSANLALVATGTF